MSSELFEVGLKTLKALLNSEDTSAWYRFKLKEDFFKGNEVDVFNTVQNHLTKYSALPNYETVENLHPYLKPIKAVEPPTYYRDLLISRFTYETIRQTNQKTQEILSADKLATDKAFKVLQDASSLIIDTQYNDKLFNFRTDAKQIMLNEYYHSAEKQRHLFHWEFMDEMSNGYYGGDVVSFVGRPAKGKTFMLLRSALENWRNLGAKPLVATMEMNYVAIMQRLSAMYGNVNLSQLRNKSFATSSEKLFRNSLNTLSSEQSDFYIVDGNLAATPEQIYTLAHNLGCDSVYIDGAYMLKSSNPRLDRFTRVAENVELMKQYTSNLDVPTVASWQLNRDGAKSKKVKGEKGGLENIGYSDAIGQISSIVLALEEEDSAETLHRRKLRLLKGRNGEVGEFDINWHFHNMNFDQVDIDDAPLENI